MVLMILFISFLLFMALGFPIAFAMLLSSLLYIVFNGSPAYIFVAQRITSSLISFPLLAIPFFVVAGNLMNELDISRRIFNFASSLVGHLKGGLAHVNIIASFIFSGMSGSAAADAGGLGLIEIRAMERENYPSDFSAAITAASAAIGPIVPPSVMLVIYGVMTGTSVGRLFIAGIVPGIMMVLCLMIAVHIISIYRDFPTSGSFSFKRMLQSLKEGFFALLTPIILLYLLITGIVTPSELGVILIFYLLLMGIIYRTISFQVVKRALIESLFLNAQVLFLIATASIFGNILLRENVPGMLMVLIERFPILNEVTFLILLSLVLLFLGCFVEGVAILSLMVPIVAPIAASLHINPVQLGLVMVLAIMLGLITPPLGIGVFITSDIAGVPVNKVFKESFKFLIPLVIVLLLTIFFSETILYLPRLVFGG